MHATERWRDATDTAAPYGDTLRSTLDRARERLADVASEVAARTSGTRNVAMRATENYVAASPYTTIAVAAAVGLAIGMLVMASRSRRHDYDYR